MPLKEISQRLRRVDIEAPGARQDFTGREFRYRVGPLLRVDEKAAHRHLLEKFAEQFGRRLVNFALHCIVGEGGTRQHEHHCSNDRREGSREEGVTR